LKKAIVSGASSGIGKSCVLKLLEMGYSVVGLSRTCSIDDANYEHISIDLRDSKKIQKLDISDAYILINASGVGHFAPHEELSFKQIEEMISLNLTAPLLLSRQYLRSLKKNGGYIFNINSISGVQPAIFGAAYGASKAALIHFSTSLFKEARKSGLKVININPDITNTPFFDGLNFEPTKNPLCFIEPKDISEVIEDVLNKREGTVITDITIQPQLFQISKK
jgi:short-subunit dehydrogenase